MRAHLRSVLLVAGLTSVGCSGVCGDASSDSEAGEGSGGLSARAVSGTPVPAADTESQRLFNAVGAGAPWVVVARLDRWNASTNALVDVMPAIGLLDSPDRLVKALAAAVEIPIGDGQVAALDPTRPMIGSLLEPPFGGQPTSGTAAAPLTRPEHDGMRTQFVFPSTDVAKTAASLEELLAETGEPYPELVEGHKGASARFVRTRWPEAGFIAVLPEDNYVRVVAVHWAMNLDRRTGLERWRERLSVEPASLDTPAVRHALRPEHAVAVVMRPWHFRALASWMGLTEGRRALAEAPPDQRAIATLVASYIVLDGELLMRDEGAEFDDIALSASADASGVRMQGVLSLTPRGREIWDAGRRAAEDPVGLAAEDVVDDLWLRVGVAPMVAAASAPLQAQASQREFARRFQNCGFMCPAHWALRAPFGAVKTLMSGEDAAPFASSVGVTSIRVVRTASEGVAVGVTFDSEGARDAAKRMLDEFGGVGLQVHSAARLTTPVLLVGAGVDPRTVLDANGSVDDADGASAWVASGLTVGKSEVLMALLGELGIAGSAFDDLRWNLRLAGDALSTETVFARAGKVASAFDPAFSGMDWGSPLRAAPATSGAKCLIAGGEAVVKTFRAGRDAPSDKLGAAFGHGREALAEAIACAEEDPVTAKDARSLRRLLAVVAADTLVGLADHERMQSILSTECAATKDPVVCERSQAATALPKVEPLAMHLPQACSDNYEDYSFNGLALPLVHADGKLFFQGRPLAMDPKAIADALIATKTPHELDRKDFAVDVSLVVKGDTPVETMLPVFEALAALGNEHVRVGVQTKDGLWKSPRMRLGVKPKFTVDASPPAGWVNPYPDEIMEEEPPPEERDVGFRGGRKTMVFDQRPLPHVVIAGTNVAIDPYGETAVIPEGNPVPELRLRGQFSTAKGATLAVAEGTPWRSLAVLVGTLCDRPPTFGAPSQVPTEEEQERAFEEAME